MSKIIVQDIANEIFDELDKLYKEDIQELMVKKVQEVEGGREDQIIAMLGGLSNALQNHLERFTIQLVQEVVDRIQE